MTEQRTPVLHVGTDSHGRTWRVLEREDSFSVYYTVDDSPAHHVLYDSLDEWRDPPRVLLGRMQQAQRKAAELRAENATLKTYIGDIGYILEYARAMALGDGSKDMTEAISETIRLRKELTK